MLAGRLKLVHPSHFPLSPDQFSLQMLLSVPPTEKRPSKEEEEATLLSDAAA